MIENFSELKEARISYFKSLVLKSIEETLDRVNLSILSTNSYIEISKNIVIISLVHKDDKDSIVSLNILEDHVTLCFSDNEIRFEKENIDLDYLKGLYLKCLTGEYETTDLYYKEKLIYCSAKILDTDIIIRTPRSLVYTIYVWFYYKYLITKTVKFRSFIN